jgi:hypothetical protein
MVKINRNDLITDVAFAFAMLPLRYLMNISWHLHRDTPVCCGPYVKYWCTAGGNCDPIVMAADTVIPYRNVDAPDEKDPEEAKWLHIAKLLRCPNYVWALSCLSDTSVREALSRSIDFRLADLAGELTDRDEVIETVV